MDIWKIFSEGRERSIRILRFFSKTTVRGTPDPDAYESVQSCVYQRDLISGDSPDWWRGVASAPPLDVFNKRHFDSIVWKADQVERGSVASVSGIGILFRFGWRAGMRT